MWLGMEKLPVQIKMLLKNLWRSLKAWWIERDLFPNKSSIVTRQASSGKKIPKRTYITREEILNGLIQFTLFLVGKFNSKVEQIKSNRLLERIVFDFRGSTVRVLKGILAWSWYEILFGVTRSLPLNRARATSKRIGLFSKNIFWKIDFSVVFTVSFPENTISVFVLGVALTEVIQCMFKLTLVFVMYFSYFCQCS